MDNKVLFRGLRVDGGGWAVGSLILPNSKNSQCYIIGWNGAKFEVIPETVGQYTGLKDKEGVKIFKGDWLQSSPGYASYVDFENGSFVSVYSHPEDGETLIIEDLGLIKDGVLDVTVIGNIHESEGTNEST